MPQTGMQKHLPHILGAIALLLVGVLVYQNYSQANEIATLQTEVASLQTDRNQFLNDLNSATNELNGANATIDNLREEIIKKLKVSNKIRINIIEIKEPDREAVLIGQWIAQQLEKRVAFRRTVRQGIQKANKANIDGIKVQISGRLNGAEIARTEWVREGRVPLQTLRANIDYAYTTAYTIYGILGIKIWLFKDEKSKI